MKDRYLGEAIIVIGCLLMVTRLISLVMVAVFYYQDLHKYKKILSKGNIIKCGILKEVIC